MSKKILLETPAFNLLQDDKGNYFVSEIHHKISEDNINLVVLLADLYNKILNWNIEAVSMHSLDYEIRDDNKYFLTGMIIKVRDDDFKLYFEEEENDLKLYLYHYTKCNILVKSDEFLKSYIINLI